MAPASDSLLALTNIMNRIVALLPIRFGPVGDDGLAILLPDHGGGVGRVEPTGEDPGAGLPDLVVERVHIGVDLLQDVGRKILRPLIIEH